MGMGRKTLAVMIWGLSRNNHAMATIVKEGTILFGGIEVIKTW
jgi:hypothetical protein